MEPVKLITFDCDGVLIDSEIIVCRLMGEEMTRLGNPMTTEFVIGNFAGRPESEVMAEVERTWGRPVPAEYYDRMKTRTTAAYIGEPRAIPHIAEVLGRIRVPVCVASSSLPDKLKLGLESVGLDDFFGPNLVSGAYVAHGKPAPDIFVYAAGWMRTPIRNCVVVEDSLPGTRAARAAGARVFGFTGGTHCRPDHADRLLEAGAERVFADMRELESLVPSAFDRSLQLEGAA